MNSIEVPTAATLRTGAALQDRRSRASRRGLNCPTGNREDQDVSTQAQIKILVRTCIDSTSMSLCDGSSCRAV